MEVLSPILYSADRCSTGMPSFTVPVLASNRLDYAKSHGEQEKNGIEWVPHSPLDDLDIADDL